MEKKRKVEAVATRKMDTSDSKIDAITLRKLREIRGLSRKEAAVLLGMNFKSVERFENGRSTVSKDRIDKAISAYGFTSEDFLLCREGKSEQIEKRFCHKKKKPYDYKKGRRFYTKVITKEVKVLRLLRQQTRLSQRRASTACGYHEAAIGGIENGRVELSMERISHIVESYGFTMEDFDFHMNAEILVTEVQDECISIIRGLSEKNLKAVYPLLLNFKL